MIPTAVVNDVVERAAAGAERDRRPADVLRVQVARQRRCASALIAVLVGGGRQSRIVVDDRRIAPLMLDDAAGTPRRRCHRQRLSNSRARPRPHRGPRPASTSIRAARITDSCSRSAGPRPFKVSMLSTTSLALPTARPSGASIRVISASVLTPDALPIATSDSARRRESSSVFMNAPAPVLTSSTRPPMPSAIFLLMIEADMSGNAFDGAGHVAQRVERCGRPGRSPRSARSARRRPPRPPSRNSSSDSAVRNPGIDSSLSRVPPVCPSPRPDIIGTTAPHAIASGARIKRGLVADAAGTVLVDRDRRKVRRI